MGDFTYRVPDFGKFLATMRVTLDADRKSHWSALLEGATGEFYCSNTYSSRWNAYWAELRLQVPADKLPNFNSGAKTMLLAVAQTIMPPDSGYDLREVSVTALMVGSDDEITQLPAMDAFLHSLRLMLNKQGNDELVPLLLGVEGTFLTRRNNVYLRLRVPLDRIDAYTATALARITDAGRPLLRSGNGDWLEGIEVDPAIESPPDEDAPRPRPSFKPANMYEHDRLYFRSKTEIRVYEALKKRNVLFFANATAVLGGKFDPQGKVRLFEPDFLVCQDGRWGILEPGGDGAHTPQNSTRDHERARMFNDYGVTFHQFYGADQCYRDPEGVVEDFLTRLARSRPA